MYRISFQQIHYFLTVAKTLNFTEASKALYISQPALSKQINVLEEELGFLVLKRNKRNVILTPEGELLYKDWQILENMLESSVYRAKLIKCNTTGSLRIGCIDSFSVDSPLYQLLNSFREKYPKIDLDLSSYGFRVLREQFNNGEFDIIFIPDFECSHFKNIQKLTFMKVNLCIAVPIKHPLSKKEVVTMYDLKSEPIIAISPKESLNGLNKVKAYFNKYGLEPNIVKYASNLNSLILAVKNGFGITICENSISDPTIKKYDLEDQPHDSDIVAIWKSDIDKAELDLFLSELNELIEEE